MSHSRANIASFSRCAECGAEVVEPVSDAAICFSVDDGPTRIIPRSQEAQLLRFLWTMRPHTVVRDHMYRALGRCHQVSRAIGRLRRKWEIPINCDQVDKASARAGQFGKYYLGSEVAVWEPENSKSGEA